MAELTIPAAIAALAAIVGAAIAYRAQREARRANRTADVEAQLEKLNKDNHLLYLWNRQLVDHIYADRKPPPPSPPAGLFED